jgi:hypothetical protein
MVSRRTSPVTLLGFWSAVAAAISSAAVCVATSLILLKVLVPPWDIHGSLIPSLTLAPAFLAMMVCVHATLPAEKRIWGQLAVAFSAVYVPLVSMSYVVEMLVVSPRMMRGELDAVSILTITSTSSVFNAIDGLGYAFMSLASLCAAPAFTGGRLERWIRWLLVGNAVLLIPTVLTYFVSRSFMVLVTPWVITVPGSTLLIAVRFWRAER